mgnify:CR=1 FL=1
MKKLEEYVRSIPDFPEPGIIFRDITTILQDADGLQLAIEGIQKSLEGVDYDIVVGPESRGFIFGVPVAYAMHKGFVPIRKKGKLPCKTVSVSYDLEYGSAVLEMHEDAIKPGQKVVIVEDKFLVIREYITSDQFYDLKKTTFLIQQCHQTVAVVNEFWRHIVLIPMA